ncbi:putative membrane protein YGL010W [Flavobacterium sp. 28A]|uniref:Mpo1 family 2-hydroxy fatty acid dioxygenase n=1 Tax=Flavobacterium sp. 28A TaxID=2735895 RepID=UPI00156E0501|nr:Mpo1-like protein [Flavobacterium sp. 28A]NRT15032.1 putative membrane protein YGL010W [Flavobacterium sp. 28A]
MKTLPQWFEEYGVSHKNVTNKKIHYICVPLIFFSVVGLFMSIPNQVLTPLANLHPVFANWGFIALVFVLLFYFRLSLIMGLKMLLFTTLCLIGNYIISQTINILWFSIAVFAIGWIGQFYGHKIEGKKPSFIKDLQFLLIGPAWVIDSVLKID